MPKKSPKNRKVPEEIREENPKGIYILLIILTALGAALRFYHLDFNSLWLDEISTYTYSNSSFGGMWDMMAGGTDYSPPVFFIMEHFMLQIFGVSETTLRYLPALFGTLTIPMMYLVGKEFRDKYTGLIAAGMFAFSPFLIFYSQEARPYALVLLLCVVLIWAVLRAMKTNTTKDWIYVALVSASLFWTHFFAPVFVVLVGGYILFRFRGEIKPLLVSFIIGVLLIIPILAVLIPLFFKHTSHAPTYGLQGIELLYSAFFQLSGYSELSMMLFLSFFILGIYWLYIKEKENAAFLLWLISAMLVVSLFMSYRMPMLPRYMISLTIPLSLGIGTAYEPLRNILAEGFEKKKIVLGIIIIFGLLATPYYLSYYQGYSKQNWKGISSDLNMITASGDTVVVVPYYIKNTLGFYYSPVKDQTIYIAPKTLNELMNAKAKDNRSIYYVVTSDINAEDPSGQMVAYLNEYSRMFRNYGTVWIAKGV